MGEVIWSLQARNDLDEIVDHVALDSPSRAEDLHWAVFHRTVILSDHPLAGHPVHEIADVRFRELQCGNYRVIYWLKTENNVVILTVRHGKRRTSASFLRTRRRSA